MESVKTYKHICVFDKYYSGGIELNTACAQLNDERNKLKNEKHQETLTSMDQEYSESQSVQ